MMKAWLAYLCIWPLKIVAIIIVYIAATLIFPYSWLTEQRTALYMAWLDSFAPANEYAVRLWRA